MEGVPMVLEATVCKQEVSHLEEVLINARDAHGSGGSPPKHELDSVKEVLINGNGAHGPEGNSLQTLNKLAEVPRSGGGTNGGDNSPETRTKQSRKGSNKREGRTWSWRQVSTKLPGRGSNKSINGAWSSWFLEKVSILHVHS